MGYDARSNQILEFLRKTGTAQATQLSELLHVSLVTIRKDLQRMGDEGLLHRTHGGAAIREQQSTQDPRINAMEAIAEKVVREIYEGDCVIMNAGNTTLLAARKLLGRKNITIITNSIAIARELVQQTGIKLIFLGGEVNAEAVFTYGWDAVTQLEQYKANKLIALLIKFGVVCGIKDILDKLGFDCGYQVYPQKRFKDEERDAFRAALKEIRFEEEYI